MKYNPGSKKYNNMAFPRPRQTRGSIPYSYFILLSDQGLTISSKNFCWKNLEFLLSCHSCYLGSQAHGCTVRDTHARVHTHIHKHTPYLIPSRREIKSEHRHEFMQVTDSKAVSYFWNISHCLSHTPHQVFRLRLQGLRHLPDHMVIVAISRIKWHKAPPTPPLPFGTI